MLPNAILYRCSDTIARTSSLYLLYSTPIQSNSNKFNACCSYNALCKNVVQYHAPPLLHTKLVYTNQCLQQPKWSFHFFLQNNRKTHDGDDNTATK